MDKFIDEFKSKSDNLIQAFKKEIGSVRTGRPTTALIEDLKVSYYDNILPLKQLASLGVVPPRTIQIQAWDKEAVNSIAKAIENSSLSLSVSIDGNILRVNLPELSEERRRELVRHVKKVAEEFRISLRLLRDEANKKIQKMLDDDAINENQKFKLREEIQKIVDEVNSAIESALDNKIKEIQE